ncbi:MAG: hypothetical protein AVDCRST_MAG08-2685, partial [uncultured Acetobacteraceae bacterium]
GRNGGGGLGLRPRDAPRPRHAILPRQGLLGGGAGGESGDVRRRARRVRRGDRRRTLGGGGAGALARGRRHGPLLPQPRKGRLEQHLPRLGREGRAPRRGDRGAHHHGGRAARS